MTAARATWAAGVGLTVVWLGGCDSILNIHPPHDRVGTDSGGAFAEASFADSDDGPAASDGGGGDDGSDVVAPSDAFVDGGCEKGQVACAGGCMSPNDVRSCGPCDHDCTQLPNISAAGLVCNSGQCVYTCALGYADCADAGAGCSTYLGLSSTCGACSVACSGNTPYCQQTGTAGNFACVSTCSPLTPTACNGSCIDERTDNRNCGGCGASFACAGAQTCQGRVCGCMPCVLDLSNLDQCCLQ
jgi:hypothetical protein